MKIEKLKSGDKVETKDGSIVTVESNNRRGENFWLVWKDGMIEFLPPKQIVNIVK
ncbi:MAG: hypothetical protein AABY07_01055 [Nanoarchaeota archaeon]